MRLPNDRHSSPSWRIGGLTADFRLEDVWALPAEGDADAFDALLEVMAAIDPAQGASRPTRLLFRVRHRLGAWCGWDAAAAQLPLPGRDESTLRRRLPDDLRNTVSADGGSPAGFTPLYRTADEWAAELSNRTVHAVMHLAWVDQGAGRYRGQLGVYVLPRGRLGAVYMALIAPLRHHIVYPALMRQIEQAWTAHLASAPEGPHPSLDASRTRLDM